LNFDSSHLFPSENEEKKCWSYETLWKILSNYNFLFYVSLRHLRISALKDDLGWLDEILKLDVIFKLKYKKKFYKKIIWLQKVKKFWSPFIILRKEKNCKEGTRLKCWARVKKLCLFKKVTWSALLHFSPINPAMFINHMISFIYLPPMKKVSICIYVTNVNWKLSSLLKNIREENIFIHPPHNFPHH
jgi:hypothetical protein